MKKFSLLFLSTIIYCTGFTQNVGVGTNTPNASAKLDVTSTSSGILIPRMTSAQRTTIATPAQGLLVYDTNTNSFWFYNASTWTNLVSSGWALTGNSGTDPSNNFIGTTDDQPLIFKVNNTWAGQLHPDIANIFLGVNSGKAATSGVANSGFGYNTLAKNTVGQANTAMGSEVLRSNTTGNYNTGMGLYALLANTTGNDNTANGAYALYANHTGGQNVAIGRDALFAQSYDPGSPWASGNVAVGYRALFQNQPTSTSNGMSNTAVGDVAMQANTTGFDNAAFGAGSLYTNTTGFQNTAIGRQALFYNTTGFLNTSTGFKALRNNTDGSGNTANGTFALYSNTSGFENVALGDYALYTNTTGHDNVGIGESSDVDLSNSNYNTILGSYAHVSGSNDVAIGYTSYTNVDNLALLGSTITVQCGGYANWSNFSDGRFKTNVKENVKGLDFILKLRPVTYHMDVRALYNLWGESPYGRNSANGSQVTSMNTAMITEMDQAISNKESISMTGFIAQEVEQAAQQSGYDFDGVIKPAHNKDHYRLAYAEFVVPLVKAMQEQQTMIDLLKNENARQQAAIDLLTTRLNNLEKSAGN